MYESQDFLFPLLHILIAELKQMPALFGIALPAADRNIFGRTDEDTPAFFYLSCSEKTDVPSSFLLGLMPQARRTATTET